jgi:phytoene dehydrogenase-like protein
MSRPIIIGAGHNALVCAAYLAKAGLRPLVLEARDVVGGCVVTRELAPGIRVPALTHAVAMRADVLSDLGLGGLAGTPGTVSVTVPTRDGRALVVPRETSDAAAALATWSARDAERWPAFASRAHAITSALQALLTQVPPSIDTPAAGELWALLQAGRRLRGLGKSQLYDLLRWGPMSIADLAAEWFETPALRAALCARGVFGAAAGPRSAGTAVGWLLNTATDGHPTGELRMLTGGPGMLAAALASAASAAGAEIRTNAPVARIDVDDSGATAVTLASGERLEASVIVSGADPKRTFLTLVDPMRLQPSFRQQILNFRAAGVLAKVNLAVSGLPPVRGVDATRASQLLSGRILVGDEPDELERAFDASKYGQISERPWLEVTIPTVTDPSLAPSGTHVISVYAQYAPHKLRDGHWETAKPTLEQRVLTRLGEVMPGLSSMITAVETLTPADLEREYHLTGGHIFHGEHALDQIYAMRPVLGWAQHRTPIARLFLCGAGTHPGGGVTGGPGAHAARVVLGDLKRSR